CHKVTIFGGGTKIREVLFRPEGFRPDGKNSNTGTSGSVVRGKIREFDSPVPSSGQRLMIGGYAGQGST
ncbi:MAG: hypothetical protein ACRCW3_00775, partial [Metamycoplasmataceae bacterium]